MSRHCVYGLAHHKNCSCGGPVDLSVVVDGQTKQMSESEIVDYLTYANYKHNRELSPNTTPEQWAVIYGPSTPAMEARYQREKSA